MTIREAQPDDAEELIAYIHRLDDEPDSMLPRAPGEFLMTVQQEQALLAEYAASDNAIYLVAVVDGIIVGSLSGSGGKRQAMRHTADFGLSVTSECCGQGISIIRRLDLEVYAHNDPAIHLYQKFGFIEEGRRRQAFFQQGRFIDGILMARLL